MKIILTILISMISLITPAQTYRQLWQKVDEAAKNDLPKTQLSAIKQIAAKAMKEKAYGQLLKAQLKEGAVLASISPDSLKPALHRMEQTYNRLSDPTVKAVYATAIGKKKKLTKKMKKKTRQYRPLMPRSSPTRLTRGSTRPWLIRRSSPHTSARATNPRC